MKWCFGVCVCVLFVLFLYHETFLKVLQFREVSQSFKPNFKIKGGVGVGGRAR